MPDDTVLDGEVVALDDEGRPSFNLLQNYGSAGAPLHFFIFDVLILSGKEVMGEPLVKRGNWWKKHVLPKLEQPISLKDLIHCVKSQTLEGLIAKLNDSKYEPGLCSGAWLKIRVNQGQEFVSGGYTVGGATFDALVFGYYEGGKLIYTARTRKGRACAPVVIARLGDGAAFSITAIAALSRNRTPRLM